MNSMPEAVPGETSYTLSPAALVVKRCGISAKARFDGDPSGG